MTGKEVLIIPVKLMFKIEMLQQPSYEEAGHAWKSEFWRPKDGGMRTGPASSVTTNQTSVIVGLISQVGCELQEARTWPYMINTQTHSLVLSKEGRKES